MRIFNFLATAFFFVAIVVYVQWATASSCKIVGDSKSCFTWVYLGGLVQRSNDEDITVHQILDTVGKRLNIKIIIVLPKDRCSYLQNKLCWPHGSQQLVGQTYNYIQSCIKNVSVNGYIGFSNGGFFLSELIQTKSFEQPVILIGSAGQLHTDSQIRNKNIIFIIGKHDEYHYVYTQKLVQQMKEAHLPIKIFEHDGGHEVPENLLELAITECI